MATHLSANQKAPQFKGIDQNGNTVKLSDFKNKKLVLFFYRNFIHPPAPLRPATCGKIISLLKKNGFEIAGISPDDENSHKKFEEKFKLPFVLIADPSHSIINKYGVWGPKQLYGRKYDGLHRTTFLIDEKGNIRHIFLKPRNKEHAQEIIKKWNEINK